jgi:flagellar hook-associated protein 1
MSLTSIVTTASAALTRSQYQIALANQNVANADDPTYSRETASSTAITDSRSVSTTSVTRAANAYLTKTVVASSSAAARDATISSSLSAYDSDLGSVADGGDPSSLLTAFQTALSSLSSDSTNSTGQAAVVSSAKDLATGLRSLSSSIQGLRTQADQDLGDEVTTVNATLKSIADLNTQIAAADPKSQELVSLQDKRDAALTSLSSSLGISYFIDPSNRAQVYTASGDLLVGLTAAQFSYSPSSDLGASATYPGQIAGVILNGKDVTSSLTSGKMGGLVSLRDDVLVQEQSKLDALASGLITTLNTVTNAGTAYPPPTSLTGDVTVAGSDAFSATGTLRVAVIGATGTVKYSQDFDLSAYTTVSGLVAALNGMTGVSASISSTGKLVIASSDGVSGVSLGDISAAVAPSGGGVSSHFGLNDLFKGASASDIAVSPAIGGAPLLLPTASLSTANTLTAGAAGVTSGDTSIADALSSALTGQTSFAAAGDFPARTTSLQTYATAFVSSAAAKVANASNAASASSATSTAAQSSLANLTSVNTDEELSNLTTYQQQYEANAQMITVVRSLFTALMTMMA